MKEEATNCPELGFGLCCNGDSQPPNFGGLGGSPQFGAPVSFSCEKGATIGKTFSLCRGRSPLENRDVKWVNRESKSSIKYPNERILHWAEVARKELAILYFVAENRASAISKPETSPLQGKFHPTLGAGTLALAGCIVMRERVIMLGNHGVRDLVCGKRVGLRQCFLWSFDVTWKALHWQFPQHRPSASL